MGAEDRTAFVDAAELDPDALILVLERLASRPRPPSIVTVHSRRSGAVGALRTWCAAADVELIACFDDRDGTTVTLGLDRGAATAWPHQPPLPEVPPARAPREHRPGVDGPSTGDDVRSTQVGDRT